MMNDWDIANSKREAIEIIQKATGLRAEEILG